MPAFTNSLTSQVALANRVSENFPANSNTVIYSGVTQNFNAIYLSASSVSGGGIIQVQWYADTALSSPTLVQDFVLTALNSLDVILPALGNGVIVSLTTFASILQGTIAVFQVNSSLGKAGYVAGGMSTGELSTVLNANSTSVFNVGPIVSGPASLFLDPGAGGSSVVIQVFTLSASGAAGLALEQFTGANGAQVMNFNMPASPISIHVINQSATTAFTISWTLTVLSQ